jgi:hypothetical protein
MKRKVEVFTVGCLFSIYRRLLCGGKETRDFVIKVLAVINYVSIIFRTLN